MICKYCKSTTIKEVISDTNSIYTYCTNCKESYNLVNKHMTIDTILKQLINNLKTISTQTLKIELKQEGNLIYLIINNKIVHKTTSKYNFIKEDINHIKSIIFELVEDYYIFDKANAYILLHI